MAQAMYQQQANQNGQAQADPQDANKANNDDVVDADFKAKE